MSKRKRTGLGDFISNALSTVGVTEERVTKFLGRPCKCPERIKKLNQIGEWALGMLRKKREKGGVDLELERKTLEGIIE